MTSGAVQEQEQKQEQHVEQYEQCSGGLEQEFENELLKILKS